jgi:hypothetical protein
LPSTLSRQWHLLCSRRGAVPASVLVMHEAQHIVPVQSDCVGDHNGMQPFLYMHAYCWGAYVLRRRWVSPAHIQSACSDYSFTGMQHCHFVVVKAIVIARACFVFLTWHVTCCHPGPACIPTTAVPWLLDLALGVPQCVLPLSFNQAHQLHHF